MPTQKTMGPSDSCWPTRRIFLGNQRNQSVVHPRLAAVASPLKKDRTGERYERRETRVYSPTPTLVEICIGLEINGYLPAEF